MEVTYTEWQDYNWNCLYCNQNNPEPGDIQEDQDQVDPLELETAPEEQENEAAEERNEVQNIPVQQVQTDRLSLTPSSITTRYSVVTTVANEGNASKQSQKHKSIQSCLTHTSKGIRNLSTWPKLFTPWILRTCKKVKLILVLSNYGIIMVLLTAKKLGNTLHQTVWNNLLMDYVGIKRHIMTLLKSKLGTKMQFLLQSWLSPRNQQKKNWSWQYL